MKIETKESGFLINDKIVCASFEAGNVLEFSDEEKIEIFYGTKEEALEKGFVFEETKQEKKYNILQYVDNPNEKTVTVYIENQIPLILWAGTDYDSIGQWTEIDVEKELDKIIK